MSDGDAQSFQPPVMYRSFRYRLLPRRRQHTQLESALEQQRLLYNAALQERIDAWRKGKIRIGYIEQCASLTQVRADDPEGYGSLPVTLSRGTLHRLEEAFQGFFRRIRAGATPGFPRFKAMSRWDSISLREMSGLRLDLEGGRISIKGIDGLFRVRVHRPLPAGAVAKSATIRRCDGKWEISLQVAVLLDQAGDWSPIEVDTRPDTGIDVGIESFLVTSEGERIEGLSPGRANALERRRLQRSLARKKRGSLRRGRARKRLAAAARRDANRRKDFAHKVSHQMAQAYRVIAVEALSITNMTRSARGTAEEPGSKVRQKAGLNRSILDQGWGDFLFKLSFKAEDAGGRVVSVNPHGTSQTCSGCGADAPKTLAQRQHRCQACGLELHRDHNAARCILLRAAREGRIPARLQPSGGSTAVPRTRLTEMDAAA